MSRAVKRGVAVMLLLFAGARCESDFRPAQNDAEALLHHALSFLIAQQAHDGGWHSETHGILRSGQALTPFILQTLLYTSDRSSIIPEETLRKSVDFVRSHADEGGIVGLSDPFVLEYPNYATAYALHALSDYGAKEDSSLIRRMRRYLLDQQFTDTRGVEPNHTAYGGWGFGETTLHPGQVGHVDLSHTRRVLQALRSSGESDSTIYRNAGLFLTRMQAKDGAPQRYLDGGFYYSPVVIAANKGGALGLQQDEPIFLSYASATCDGLLALLAAGFTRNDAAVEKALSWLESHPLLDRPEGIPEDHPARWHEALFFYHLAARAEVYSQIGWPEHAKPEMVTLLRERIQPDGSFVNPRGASNKENDPLLATTLAIRVLLSVSG